MTCGKSIYTSVSGLQKVYRGAGPLAAIIAVIAVVVKPS